jgi:hypothetical protein
MYWPFVPTPSMKKRAVEPVGGVIVPSDNVP